MTYAGQRRPGSWPPPHHPPHRPPNGPRRTRHRGGCLGAFAGSARAKARAIFAAAGPGRVEDPVVTRVQLWRAALGTAATILLIATYGIDGGWKGVFSDGVSKLFLAPVVLIVVGPVVIACFIWYAPPQHRRLLRSRLRHPLKAVGWYLGAALTVLLCLQVHALLQEYHPLGMLSTLAPLVFLPIVLWMLAFLAFASGSAARYAFNTADVHAALPAVLTVALVWTLNLVTLGDGLPNGPLTVRIAAFLGGPVSVTAVALWELWYL
ncbi:hypothetical protein, partial [Streptomyces huiliensis]|uniref:hypothetical protein n=1 Tax=Streptomyces huiliensis TaxID=2876027 RepID=UPI001CBCC3E7